MQKQENLKKKKSKETIKNFNLENLGEIFEKIERKCKKKWK